MSDDRWAELRKRTWALRRELPERVADDYCPRVFDLLAERDRLAAVVRWLADEVSLLRRTDDAGAEWWTAYAYAHGDEVVLKACPHPDTLAAALSEEADHG